MAKYGTAVYDRLPLWQRLLLTIIGMVAASFVIGLLWESVLGFPIPSYVSGIVGGLTALPIWEALKRVRPKGP